MRYAGTQENSASFELYNHQIRSFCRGLVSSYRHHLHRGKSGFRKWFNTPNINKTFENAWYSWEVLLSDWVYFILHMTHLFVYFPFFVWHASFTYNHQSHPYVRRLPTGHSIFLYEERSVPHCVWAPLIFVLTAPFILPVYCYNQHILVVIKFPVLIQKNTTSTNGLSE